MKSRTWVTAAGLAMQLAALLATTAYAQDPPLVPPEEEPLPAADLETTRGLAMGSGVRASATSSSSLAYNPAGMPFARGYHIESFGAFEPAFSRWIVGGSLVDSITNKLAAGMSFRGILGNGEAGYSGMDGRLGLAFPIIEALSIGLSGRYLSLGREGQAPMGVDPNEPLAQGFTMDASIIIAPLPVLRLSAHAQNFIDLGSPLTPVMFGGSASLVLIDALTLGGDCMVDVSTFQEAQVIAGGGAEFLAGGVVPIRAGYRFDSGREIHAITAGLGYTDTRFGVDFALRQDVGGGDDTTVMLAVRYFVQ